MSRLTSSSSHFRIVMLGAPGSGKGTYAKSLAAKLPNLTMNKDVVNNNNNRPLPILSTGDMIRSEIVNNTKLGREAKEASEKGLLVPDSLVTEVVLSKLEDSSRVNYNDGFILDGYPRTLNQARTLSEHDLLSPTTVVNVDLAQDVIIEKLLGRRVCSKCGTSYNLANVIDVDRGYNMPAMLPLKGCLNTLEKRADDTLEVIQRRLEIYEKETGPLIEWYEERGLLVHFKVKNGMKDLPSLIKKIKKHVNVQIIANEWAKV